MKDMRTTLNYNALFKIKTRGLNILEVLIRGDCSLNIKKKANLFPNNKIVNNNKLLLTIIVIQILMTFNYHIVRVTRILLEINR